MAKAGCQVMSCPDDTWDKNDRKGNAEKRSDMGNNANKTACLYRTLKSTPSGLMESDIDVSFL